ncbi:MAG: dTDP-4-dehydrorhamnose 3,5-epimerase family protein [Acidimicrobiales bacterium]|nr:dTDP-4-dehydrorhamnose 3,5-epimerase family protein [Acidimicrobiales bacterium]
MLHDLRAGSPPRRHPSRSTSGRRRPLFHDHRGVHVPAGVLHGFARPHRRHLIYPVDQAHNALDEFGVAWDDPQVAADWGPEDMGVTEPILSASDQANPAGPTSTPTPSPGGGCRHRPWPAGSRRRPGGRHGQSPVRSPETSSAAAPTSWASWPSRISVVCRRGRERPRRPMSIPDGRLAEPSNEKSAPSGAVTEASAPPGTRAQ